LIEEKTASSRAVEEAKKRQVAAKPSMYIKVYSPFKTYFEGQGYSISGINATGPFDILPQHHNFVTLLSPCELSIQTTGGLVETQKIRISGGLMHVKADRITVFLDI
jgi:F0F1-type ATP synthase epsilon subunit